MSDGDRQVIPACPDLPHPLGRRGVWHDPRNRLHRALVQPPPRAAKPHKAWQSRVVFDQGQESSCTAQAAVGLLRTSPFASQFSPDRFKLDEPAERFALYREAQQFDPWEGEEPQYEGSSTDAPFKVLRNRGLIASWRWLFGEAELREWLTWFGPATVGTNWYMGMFDPDPLGVLHLTGAVAGGHAYRIVQYNPKMLGGAYRIVNSWSRMWGQAGGRAWIARADMARLLDDERGEAVTVGLDG